MIYKQWIRKNMFLISSQVVFWIVLIMMFFQVLSQVKLMNASYDIYNVMLYTLLTIPRDIYRMYPIISLLILTIFVTRLYTQNLHRNWYLLALKPIDIIKYVIQLFFVATIFVFVVGECIAPSAEQMAKKLRVESMVQYRLATSLKDVWLKEENGFTHAFYTNKMDKLENVERYLYKHKRLAEIHRASHAVYEDGKWWLQNVTISDFDDSGIHKLDAVTRLPWTIDISPSLLEMAQIKPEYRSIVSFSRLFMLPDFYGVFVASDQVLLVTRLLKPILILMTLWMVLYALVPLSTRAELEQKVYATVLAVVANTAWIFLSSSVIATWMQSAPFIAYISVVAIVFYIWGIRVGLIHDRIFTGRRFV